MFFTSVTGHIMNLDFPLQYKNWSRVPPASLLREAEIKRAVDQEKLKVAENLRNLARKCQILILWLDCDREGEAIAFEVIQICTEVNRNIGIYRAHFSAVTKRDIERAIQDLKEPNKHLADAVESRQEIDLRIGAAITRFQSLLLQPRFKDLKGQPISYGPCQFPTLGFVVERWKKIQEFVPESFWFIYCKHETEMPDRTKVAVEFIWDRKHIFNKPIAEAMYGKCRQNPQALVLSVQGSEKSRWRPLPLSTIEFQKLASRKLKIPSHRAMEIAEKLYTKGFISYPRTETDRFTNTINLQALIGLQIGHSVWGEYAQSLLNDGLFQMPRMGSHDDKAHPPIHPVKLFDRAMGGDNGGGLAHDEYRIYELITRHFLACCSKDARGYETVVRIDINSETFHANGLIIKEYNWLLIYPYEKWNGKIIPDYRQGQTFTPSAITLKESVTMPPQLITEAELITMMDKNGIGTDATIHEHIKTIQERGYAEKLANGAFQPTKLGVALVSAYETMGIDLWKPNLRAAMERNMTLIANGQMSKDDFLRQCLEELEQIFSQIMAKKEIMINAVGNFFEASTAASGNLSIEPTEERKEGGLEIECGGCEQKTLALYYLSNEMRVMSCSDCQINLKVPKKGEITALDFNCPICSFQILELKNENAHSYKICPWCFNNPPDTNDIEDMPNPTASNNGLETFQVMPCFKCTREDCKFSKAGQNQKLMPCTDCKTNHIVIKKSKKGSYFLGCSGFPQCRKAIWMSEHIENMEMMQQNCPKCRLTRLVKLKFKNTNLLDNLLSVRVAMEEGDVFCLGGCDNNDLQSLNYNYDCRRNTTNSSNQQQQITQTQIIPQQQTNNRQPSRTGIQITTNSISSSSLASNQQATNNTNATRIGFNILSNTSKLINNGIVQGPSSARSMTIETSSRSALNENKRSGLTISYETSSNTIGNKNPTQPSLSGNRSFELCTRCKKTGHSAESCPNSQQIATQVSSTQLNRQFRSPTNSSKTTDTANSANTANNTKTKNNTKIANNPRATNSAMTSGRSSSSTATFASINSSRDQYQPKENMPPSNLDSLKASSTCYKCGQIGHWAPDCTNPPKSQNFGNNTNSNARNSNLRFNQNGGESNNSQQVTCYKCKKPGHYANKCTEPSGEQQTNINYSNIDIQTFDRPNDHRSNQIDEYDEYAEMDVEQPQQHKKKGACFKCGNEGHWASSCPNDNNNNNRMPQNTPKRSYGQNNSFNSGNANNQGEYLANITCYKCNQKGHFANKCTGMQSEDGPSNNSFQGKRNYTSFQNRNGNAGNSENQRGSNRACPECGHVGRHPRGSACPSVKKKKTKPQDDEYD